MYAMHTNNEECKRSEQGEQINEYSNNAKKRTEKKRIQNEEHRERERVEGKKVHEFVLLVFLLVLLS